MLDRLHQALLFISTLLLAWLGMMALHMAGHLMYAVLAEAEGYSVDLHPLSIAAEPRFVSNPRPQLVAWGGPIWGCALPILVLWIVRATAPSVAYLAQFFAAFCLMANGGYLLIGSFIPAGDARHLLWLGAPQWTLISFGFPVLIAGIGLLHGLGRPFGVGVPGGKVNRRHAWEMTAAWIVFAAVEQFVHWWRG